uniref:Movement protein n=1 Tax=Angiostrongylus cantonensis TaxID=6313 RepID=A0A0K0CTY2_ANGCA
MRVDFGLTEMNSEYLFIDLSDIDEPHIDSAQPFPFLIRLKPSLSMILMRFQMKRRACNTPSPPKETSTRVMKLSEKVPAPQHSWFRRHVCVCHSLKLCGVSLDEVLASDILDASFRTVSDVIIDHVGAVTAETLSKLVRKIHRMFDDSALVRLVVSDQAVRRAVRLPVCAITHHGISHAAQAFYKRCCDVMDELTTEMHEPQWEISVSFPHSIMIDRNLIKVPIAMRGQCMIWEFLPHYGNGFTVEVCLLIYETFEVRVGGMNLRIIVESS